MDNFEKSYSNTVVTNQPNYHPKSPKYNLLKKPFWHLFPANGIHGRIHKVKPLKKFRGYPLKFEDFETHFRIK
jgi:hypothetical protein